MPRDMLQAYAAAELYNRKWRYYPPTLQWFSRSNSTADERYLSGESKQPISAAPPGSAEGAWVVFDTNAWKRREHVGPLNPSLFLPSEQIRQTVEEATRSQLLHFVRTPSNDTANMKDRVVAAVAAASSAVADSSCGGTALESSSSSSTAVSSQMGPSIPDESVLPDAASQSVVAPPPPPPLVASSSSSSSSMALPPSFDAGTLTSSSVHPPYTHQVPPLSSAASLLQQPKAPASMVYMYPQYPSADAPSGGVNHQQTPMLQQQPHLGIGQQQQQQQPWMTY
eukprot:GHVS01065636.1.p1 GENE.GHVS01065636.1~~GHVS01065636.1.p1  ORF type:complete len:282 (+),score=72.45 GHVS01065636.1:1-846(+)